MVQFLSIIFFLSWISSIFVGFFKSSRFFVSHVFNFTSRLLDTQPSLSRYSHLRLEIVFISNYLKLPATFKTFKLNFSLFFCRFEEIFCEYNRYIYI